MNQMQIQSVEYWESDFSLSDTDLEQIYNYFLETEQPHTVKELAGLVIESRVREQAAELRRHIADSTIYQPQRTYSIGEEVIFPALRLAKGTVTDIRRGFNPEYGEFNVIVVNVKGKTREFVADVGREHPLNSSNGGALAEQLTGNAEAIREAHGAVVAARIKASLARREDFVSIGDQWFVKSLMADVNIGHLHLAEAILEVSDGGPLTTAEILSQLELDPGIDPRVQDFSLTYHLLRDGRFDEVSPAGAAAWFLRRMEPEAVQNRPERLAYQPTPFDRGLLSVDGDGAILTADGSIAREVADRLLTPGRRLILPADPALRPHPAYLQWHRDNRFKG